jgi:DNA-directed RNA polymerase subunit F
MILERTPLNMNEVKDILKDISESDKKEEMEIFLKKFIKSKPEQSKKIKEELENLDSMKIKREHIVKVADFLPGDASDLNKIFTDVSLNEDEVNKILEIVKNSK